MEIEQKTFFDIDINLAGEVGFVIKERKFIIGIKIKHHEDETGNGYDPTDQLEAVWKQESGVHDFSIFSNIKNTLHYVKYSLHKVWLTVHPLAIYPWTFIRSYQWITSINAGAW
jgi:hypothetical protein